MSVSSAYPVTNRLATGEAALKSPSGETSPVDAHRSLCLVSSLILSNTRLGVGHLFSWPEVFPFDLPRTGSPDAPRLHYPARITTANTPTHYAKTDWTLSPRAKLTILSEVCTLRDISVSCSCSESRSLFYRRMGRAKAGGFRDTACLSSTACFLLLL